MKPYVLRIDEENISRLVFLMRALKAVGCSVSLGERMVQQLYIVEGQAPENVDPELLAVALGFSLETRYVKVLHWGESQTRRETEPSTYKFSSEFEMRSFMDGVDQANGWLEYRDLTDIDEKHWKE